PMAQPTSPQVGGDPQLNGPAGSNQVVATPDAVTSATPRIIAWQIKNIISQVRPGVVGICVGSTGQAPPWQQGWEIINPAGSWSVGSGFVVHSQGYIITNYHVVAAGGQIKVSVFSANGYKDYPARLVQADQNNDLALLKINSPQPLVSVPVGDSNKVRVGDQVIAIGNPFGLSQTVTKGIISARRKMLPMGNRTMHNLFQSDVPINPGNSGGALFNLNGEVIGVNVAIYSPVESVYTGVSFAIPINQAKALFGNYMDLTTQPVNYQWVANSVGNQVPQNVVGQSGRCYVWPTAVRPGTVSPIKPPRKKITPSPGEGIEELAWLGIDVVPDPAGPEVDEIEGISPMEAGLQAGDIIKKVNGCPTPEIYAFKDAIKKVPLKVGQGVVLDIHRPRNNKDLFISFRLKKWDLQGR
ncbi:MAG: trypsin-like peptidase domain-containing protein, partial [Planctomycetes bacterium]|nr:trypsin-like peptidase domain-containing protein [Planctomycetota bacterium]